MFSTHLFYKEGSRPGMVYPFCEKENADHSVSNGQCGSNLITSVLGDVSCPYCHWGKLKDIYATTPGLPKAFLQPMPVHWSIRPVFSMDVRVRFLRWEAACGEVSVYPELCLATRLQSEVTCEECLKMFVKEC